MEMVGYRHIAGEILPLQVGQDLLKGSEGAGLPWRGTLDKKQKKKSVGTGNERTLRI